MRYCVSIPFVTFYHVFVVSALFLCVTRSLVCLPLRLPLRFTHRYRHHRLRFCTFVLPYVVLRLHRFVLRFCLPACRYTPRACLHHLRLLPAATRLFVLLHVAPFTVTFCVYYLPFLRSGLFSPLPLPRCSVTVCFVTLPPARFCYPLPLF